MIKTYISGVRQAQITMGFPDPGIQSMPRLRQIIKGVQITRGREGKASRPRLPITPSILRKMREVWLSQGKTYEVTLMWAVAATTLFSFCRLGEVLMEREDGYDPRDHLSLRDVAANTALKPSMISILLRRSKTDQARQGVKVVIGRTGDDICPVAALLQFLAIRGNHPGPLFVWSDGKPLTKGNFITEVTNVSQPSCL